MNVYLFDGHFITLCLFFSKCLEINVEMAAGLTKALAEGSAVKREHVIVIERGREDKTCCPPCCLNSHCCFSNCFCCPFWVILVAMIILFVVFVPVIMLVKPVAAKPVSSPYSALNNTVKPVPNASTVLNITIKPVSSPYTDLGNTVKPVLSPYTALGNATQDNAITHKDGFNHSAIKDGDARHTVVNGVEIIPGMNTAGKYRARSKYCISLTNFICFYCNTYGLM